MTKRRLINIKAYDEMLLLKKLAKDDKDNSYIASIQIFYDGSEGFVIEHYTNNILKAKIVGENYTIVSKMLIEYLSKL